MMLTLSYVYSISDPITNIKYIYKYTTIKYTNMLNNKNFIR